VKPRRPTPRPTPAPTPAPTVAPLTAPVVTETKDPNTEEQKNIEQATTLPAVAPVPTNEKTETPGLLERARDAVMGGAPDVLDEYRAYLQPDDTRRNLIEISLAPALIYNDSTSPSFARSYNNMMPGLSVSADIWFTMFFGLNTSYLRTLSGAVANNISSSSFASASHEWASIGLKFRRFYGYGKNVPSLTFGLDLTEYQFRVPVDDPARAKLKTDGLKMSLEAKIPSSVHYSWTYLMSVYPWVNHAESTAGGAVLSGAENQTFDFGLGIGGEYKLERTSRIFWKAGYELQRSLFSGSASGPDAVSGATLANVPVNNGFVIFQFGYIWGK
jgi:hypothetical protein